MALSIEYILVQAYHIRLAERQVEILEHLGKVEATKDRRVSKQTPALGNT